MERLSPTGKPAASRAAYPNELSKNTRHRPRLSLNVPECTAHLHLMPEAWLRECFRILAPGGVLRLRVPVFGSPWHLIDPTHVRGFHPLNFDYFIRGRELWQKYGHYYFEFAFREGTVRIEEHNIVAILQK